ncbi:MAG: hypothetical protein K2K59_01960, partial [Muribaculaceae bacterium]|nr:hypothetical protein [Muribaculaceae bacterium]
MRKSSHHLIEYCEKNHYLCQMKEAQLTPISIVRTLDNCFPGSRAVLDSITEELNPRLQAELITGKY